MPYALVYVGLAELVGRERPWYGPGDRLPPGFALPLVPDVPITLGRSTHATVPCFSNGVARLHARVVLRGDRLLVEDLGSTNGTWVRGARVDSAELSVGEELALAGLFRFRFSPHELPAPVSGPIEEP